MAATDQTYRNQKTLDIVFGASCGLMLFSTLWMFWQDYNREFKSVQRTFRDVEAARNERIMLDKMPNADQFETKQEELTDARADLKAAEKEVAERKRALTKDRDNADDAYRSQKAEYDSKMSYYNIEIEHLGKADNDSSRRALAASVEAKKQELDRLKKRLDDKQAQLESINAQMDQEVNSYLAEPQKRVTQAEDDLKKVTETFERFAKVTAQKTWKFGDTFRALPILDAFESPTKIQQITLPELTIDYGGFKDVPRYDRCTSCHLAIDRPAFDKASLVSLGDSSGVAKLKEAKKMLEERQKKGEKLGFDPNDLPSERTGHLGWVMLILILSALVAAGALGLLEQSMSLGIRVFTVGLVISLLAGGALALFSPRAPTVTVVKLDDGQVQMYAAHPRLELFVDGNSPHSAEKFGCTICHAGQGSATDFLLAAHTPADAEQEEHWKNHYGWEHGHNWDFPMLSKRFVESSCLKCHYQVTDLISHGSKEEAPKVLRGWNLVRENGCFGCHEISGIKSGRAVGPDLRLEPQPALEYLSPSDQDKARSDPLNPPGTMRKVGPSLRRIAEKTDQAWTRRWIWSPRGFRPDTKMPHFYGLSTNSASVEDGEQKKDPEELLPSDPKAVAGDQTKFPPTEIHAIAYYLFTESKGSIEAKDVYRQFLQGQVAGLQKKSKDGPLEEKDRKDLTDISRRLVEVALVSVPASAHEINALATRQWQLQQRLQELYRKQKELKAKAAPEDLSDEEKKDLQNGGKELDDVTARLVTAGKVVPLANQLTDEEGTVVSLPELPKDDKDRQKNRDNGRKLFTEKGCLACHAHEGTTKAAPGFPTIASEATFAPNLSRIAAKIKPELGGDENARRRWLVQWIMNPSLYHPRTRMPVTHLPVAEASDIAEWLSSQEVKDWDEKDPAAPTTDDLVQLARVYLAKAPGMTREKLDAALPDQAGSQPKGVDADYLQHLAPDADERQLAPKEKDKPLTEDQLKWYIGRKSIARLGCYGCHDIPGFEQAKPIGTALNDWGKKDPERLAFEDAEVFVKQYYNVVESRHDPKDKSKPSAEWHDENGKPPYEKVYFQALEQGQRQREGFLHLKLAEPRSFDYHRILPWYDRLKMPQFKFARSHKKAGESDEAYKARQELEEAEAREAVMTFILGLVAEPVALQYVYTPNVDKRAEVKGRQVLDKYNCAGCHQIRPGVYEFKQSEDALKLLSQAHGAAAPGFATDHVFMGHNAWIGMPSPSAERLTAYAVSPKIQEVDDRNILTVRLTEALRFTGNDGVVRDLPAGSLAFLAPNEESKPPSILDQTPAFGGTFTDLMVPYLGKKYDELRGKEDDTRSKLPPPLIREGERVQPRWLYSFLLNPPPIRPTGYMFLRMPKFNMSGEEAQQLVDYFGATAKLTNPGAGVTYPYFTLPQRDEFFWLNRTQEYVKRLQDKKMLDGRVKEMEPVWEALLKKQVADAEAGLDAAKKAVEDAKKAKDMALIAQREKALGALEETIKKGKEQLGKKDFSDLRKRWETHDAYATDAYRLLTNRELCLKCHSVGKIEIEGAQGPNLALSAERLRPDWTQEWIANPVRLFPYAPNMPQNLKNNSVEYQEYFAGSSLDQVRAVRDVLMDLPRLANLADKTPPPPAPAGGGK